MDAIWSVPGYRHVRTLGEGASGTVVLAVHEETGTPAAVKYLSESLRSDPVFIGRFRDEARLMAELADPHIVRLYEYVETANAAALVMELVDGVTLKDIIGAEGATGPEAALVVLKGSLLGLAAAHAGGVVHRDYKPANILVGADGVSRLADFGIAVRAAERAPASGTPAYMAPEQWSTGVTGPASDVYAATAVCYECLTGERPFPVEGLWALAAAHRLDPVPVERVPEPLRDLVARGMAKDFADRPPSADAFLTELESVALAAYGPGWEERGRVRLAALAALLAALFPLARPAATAGTALALTRLGRRRIAVVAGVTAGALIAGGGGAFVLAGVPDGLGRAVAATSIPSTAPGPTTPAGSPAPTDGPDLSASPTPSGPAGAPATSAPATTAAPAPTTAPATPSPTPSPKMTKPAPTTVTAVSVGKVSISSSPGAAGTTYTATTDVSVAVSGPGTVTVSATETATPATAQPTQSQKVSGSGTHSVPFTWTYTQCPGSVTVSASSGGRADQGSGTFTCQPPIG